MTTLKTYATPNKHAARQATIIEPYREQFGQTAPGQYWTMCARGGAELSQVIDAGLIEPGQFHGVDHDARVIEANRAEFPEIAWHDSDFYYAMVNAGRKFQPSIVNADLVEMPALGAPYIAKIMSLLTATKTDMLLVTNFVIATRHHPEVKFDQIVEALECCPPYRLAMRSGLWENVLYYRYGGTGLRARTLMGSLVFTKHV